MLTTEKVKRLRQVISEPGYYARRYVCLMFAATHVVYNDTLDSFQNAICYYDERLLKRAEWYKSKLDIEMKQKITPFSVDHTTLEAGLYLRKAHRLNLF